MPYPYRRSYRRRYRRRRPYKKRTTAITKYSRPKDTFDYARQAWKAAMQLKRMVNVEYKKHYFADTNLAPTLSWQIRTLSLIPQGDGSFQRDGIGVKPQNLSVFLNLGASADGTVTTYRIVILRGKHEQGDGATEYLNAYEDGSAPRDLMSFKRNDERFNSKTLHDQLYHVEATNPAGAAINRFFRFDIKLTGHITFDGTNTDAEDGGLYMLYCTNLTETVGCEVNSVLSFTDN